MSQGKLYTGKNAEHLLSSLDARRRRNASDRQVFTTQTERDEQQLVDDLLELCSLINDLDAITYAIFEVKGRISDYATNKT